MPHTAESVPAEVVLSMLTSGWNQYSGHLPTPTFVDVADIDRALRHDLTRNRHLVLIRADAPGEEETPIGNWIYVNRLHRVLLEIYTNVDRQRLYDMKREIRRIAHTNRHSLAEYQRIRYNSFVELVQENMRIWIGRIILTLESNAVLAET